MKANSLPPRACIRTTARGHEPTSVRALSLAVQSKPALHSWPWRQLTARGCVCVFLQSFSPPSMLPALPCRRSRTAEARTRPEELRSPLGFRGAGEAPRPWQAEAAEAMLAWTEANSHGMINLDALNACLPRRPRRESPSPEDRSCRCCRCQTRPNFYGDEAPQNATSDLQRDPSIH
jgi:hypothetical protein